MLKNSPVPMPAHHIKLSSLKNGTVYVSHVFTSYRDKISKKPTYDSVNIGKKDNATGMLIPNGKYYEIYGTIIDGEKNNS